MGCPCPREIKDQTWDVLTLGLPKTVDPTIFSVNIGYYILKQTHEPYFRFQAANGEYTSKILSNWKLNYKDNSLTLCTKPETKFENNVSFNPYYIKNHLTPIFNKTKISFKTKIVLNCITFSFQNKETNILKLLSSYGNAPSVKTSYKNIEYGLGEYYCQSIAADHILLVKRSNSNSYFKDIRFTNYKEGRKEEIMSNPEIEDFNRVYVADIPPWVVKNYASYGISLLQTIVLLINVKDPKIRGILYNCTDIKKLRQAFMPGQKEFFNIANILPIGMIGAKEGLAKQSCNPDYEYLKSYKAKASLKLWNWKSDNLAQMTKFVENLNKHLRLNIKLINVDENKLIEEAFKKPHPWDLVIVALGATAPSYSAFIKYLFDDKYLLYDLKIPNNIKSVFQEISRNDDGIKSNIGKILAYLTKERSVLPLYQEVRKFYYPKDLKNLGLGNTLLEYPEVGVIQR